MSVVCLNSIKNQNKFLRNLAAGVRALLEPGIGGGVAVRPAAPGIGGGVGALAGADECCAAGGGAMLREDDGGIGGGTAIPPVALPGPPLTGGGGPPPPLPPGVRPNVPPGLLGGVLCLKKLFC